MMMMPSEKLKGIERERGFRRRKKRETRGGEEREVSYERERERKSIRCLCVVW